LNGGLRVLAGQALYFRFFALSPLATRFETDLQHGHAGRLDSARLHNLIERGSRRISDSGAVRSFIEMPSRGLGALEMRAFPVTGRVCVRWVEQVAGRKSASRNGRRVGTI